VLTLAPALPCLTLLPHHSLPPAKAEAVVKEIKASGGQAIAVGGNVMDDGFAKKLVDATVAAFGQINHIVNNAGFTSDKMLHTMSDDTFRLILEAHNVAPFRIVREAAPFLRNKDAQAKAQNRSIVNVSSIAGVHGGVGQANCELGARAV